MGRVSVSGPSCDNREVTESGSTTTTDNGYNIMGGWRVGQSPEESTTRSGLLVPIGT